MKINIMTTNYLGTGGDCVSHYLAMFAENPTLEEFLEWILNERKGEWGYVILNDGKSMFGKKLIEYRRGKIEGTCSDYESIKHKTICLNRMDGGYSRQDYCVTYV